MPDRHILSRLPTIKSFNSLLPFRCLVKDLLPGYRYHYNKNIHINTITVTIKKPASWLVVLYDVPTEPSKFKVRLWRDFKRMGAIYPQMSICIIPDEKENRKNLERMENIIKKDGRLMKIHGISITENDQNRILHIFRVERDKQYDEILEECHEYIDEINLNIKNKKTTQEEVEEMEEALDGLRRWLVRVKSVDWVARPAAAVRVEKLLVECQDLLHNFTELSHPKKSNRSHPISESVRS
ncbi:MAG: Chromate resistance protein ChrB [Candidatus Nitrosopolaris sp.]|jgi:hypothetical protein